MIKNTMTKKNKKGKIKIFGVNSDRNGTSNILSCSGGGNDTSSNSNSKGNKGEVYPKKVNAIIRCIPSGYDSTEYNSTGIDSSSSSCCSFVTNEDSIIGKRGWDNREDIIIKHDLLRMKNHVLSLPPSLASSINDEYDTDGECDTDGFVARIVLSKIEDRLRKREETIRYDLLRMRDHILSFDYEDRATSEFVGEIVLSRIKDRLLHVETIVRESGSQSLLLQPHNERGIRTTRGRRHRSGRGGLKGRVGEMQGSNDVLLDDVEIKVNRKVSRRRLWWRRFVIVSPNFTISTKIGIMIPTLLLSCLLILLLLSHSALVIHRTYIDPIIEASRWNHEYFDDFDGIDGIDDHVERNRRNLSTEHTYYNRKCTAVDVTTSNRADFIINPPSSPLLSSSSIHQHHDIDSAVDTIMHHGVAMLPYRLLSSANAEALRVHVLDRNDRLTSDEEIPLDSAENRWSFGIDANEHPSVTNALEELGSNDYLRRTLEGLLGSDPSIVEITVITVAHGAEEQGWHADTKSWGSPVQYARSFTQSYSLFVPLQDVTHAMGSTEICPGTHRCADEDLENVCIEHGLQVAGSSGNSVTGNGEGKDNGEAWEEGRGVLFNQNLWHRGTAHRDPSGGHRVVFVLTFVSRPGIQGGSDRGDGKHCDKTKRCYVKHEDHRQLSSGTYFHMRPDMYGHTFRDLRRASTVMSWPFAPLRALGLWKRQGANWGWDWITVTSLRIANGENGYQYGDLQDFLGISGDIDKRERLNRDRKSSFLSNTVERSLGCHGSFPLFCFGSAEGGWGRYIPAFLHGTITERGGGWDLFIRTTLPKIRTFACILYMCSIILLVLLRYTITSFSVWFRIRLNCWKLERIQIYDRKTKDEIETNNSCTYDNNIQSNVDDQNNNPQNLMSNQTIEKSKKAKLLSFICFNIITHLLLLYVWCIAMNRIHNTNWARGVNSSTVFARPFTLNGEKVINVDNGNDKSDKSSSSISLGRIVIFPLPIPAIIDELHRYDGGISTHPERNDVLLGTRYNSHTLGSYEAYLNYHPGNMHWMYFIKSYLSLYDSYMGINGNNDTVGGTNWKCHYRGKDDSWKRTDRDADYMQFFPRRPNIGNLSKLLLLEDDPPCGLPPIFAEQIIEEVVNAVMTTIYSQTKQDFSVGSKAGGRFLLQQALGSTNKSDNNARSAGGLWIVLKRDSAIDRTARELTLRRPINRNRILKILFKEVSYLVADARFGTLIRDSGPMKKFSLFYSSMWGEIILRSITGSTIDIAKVRTRSSPKPITTLSEGKDLDSLLKRPGESTYFPSSFKIQEVQTTAKISCDYSRRKGFNDRTILIVSGEKRNEGEEWFVPVIGDKVDVNSGQEGVWYPATITIVKHYSKGIYNGEEYKDHIHVAVLYEDGESEDFEIPSFPRNHDLLYRHPFRRLVSVVSGDTVIFKSSDCTSCPEKLYNGTILDADVDGTYIVRYNQNRIKRVPASVVGLVAMDRKDDNFSNIDFSEDDQGEYGDDNNGNGNSYIDSCTDDHELCLFWAEEGECEINKEYMRLNCKASCRTCKY